uniref:Uncharacterized protein n=1 Tax=Knipowitschia caucasica TaxID=637954 RepID=A0AAV2KKN3_KNICA
MALSVFGGAGVVLDGLAGGLPLAAGLAYVAGVGVKAIGKITTSKSLKKLKSLLEAYRGIIKTLKLKMLDVVREMDTHKPNVQDTVLSEALKLRAKVTDAISTLNECQRDESENYKMVREYRDQVELLKPTMERFR